jgi:uncharacterized protein YkuJ
MLEPDHNTEKKGRRKFNRNFSNVILITILSKKLQTLMLQSKQKKNKYNFT